MDFKEYQKLASTTMIYGEGNKVIYPTLGLCGEAGEVAEKVKKIMRDKEGIITEKEEVEIIVCKVGSTILHYDARAIDDLHQMLKEHGDWMEMGSKDEKPATKEGTVEHWARNSDNPISGWYGLKKNFRGDLEYTVLLKIFLIKVMRS